MKSFVRSAVMVAVLACLVFGATLALAGFSTHAAAPGPSVVLPMPRPDPDAQATPCPNPQAVC